MEIVDEAKGNEFKANNDTNINYEVVDFDERETSRRYLVYSKNATNNLPLTTTMIDR